jgi:hypothetical protein
MPVWYLKFLVFASFIAAVLDEDHVRTCPRCSKK